MSRFMGCLVHFVLYVQSIQCILGPILVAVSVAPCSSGCFTARRRTSASWQSWVALGRGGASAGSSTGHVFGKDRKVITYHSQIFWIIPITLCIKMSYRCLPERRQTLVLSLSIPASFSFLTRLQHTGDLGRAQPISYGSAL